MSIKKKRLILLVISLSLSICLYYLFNFIYFGEKWERVSGVHATVYSRPIPFDLFSDGQGKFIFVDRQINRYFLVNDTRKKVYLLNTPDVWILNQGLRTKKNLEGADITSGKFDFVENPLFKPNQFIFNTNTKRRVYVSGKWNSEP